jgi:hypothetical protein
MSEETPTPEIENETSTPAAEQTTESTTESTTETKTEEPAETGDLKSELPDTEAQGEDKTETKDNDSKTDAKDNDEFEEEEEAKPKSKALIIIIVVVAVVVIVGVICAVVFLRSSQVDEATVKDFINKHPTVPATPTDADYTDFYNFYTEVKKSGSSGVPTSIVDSYTSITSLETFKSYSEEKPSFLTNLHEYAKKLSTSSTSGGDTKTPLIAETTVAEIAPKEGAPDPNTTPLWVDINAYTSSINKLEGESEKYAIGMKAALIYFAIYTNYGFGLVNNSKEFQDMSALVKKIMSVDVYNCLLHFRQLVPLLSPIGTAVTTIFFDTTTGTLSAEKFKERHDELIEKYVQLNVGGHIVVNCKNNIHALNFAFDSEYPMTAFHDGTVKPVLDQLAEMSLKYEPTGSDDDNKAFFNALIDVTQTFMTVRLTNPYFWKGFARRARPYHPNLSHIPKSFPPLNAQFELFQAIVACMNNIIRVNDTSDPNDDPIDVLEVDSALINKYDALFENNKIVPNADIGVWIKLSEFDTSFNTNFGGSSSVSSSVSSSSEEPAKIAGEDVNKSANVEPTKIADETNKAASGEQAKADDNADAGEGTTKPPETFFNPYTRKLECFESKYNILRFERFRAGALTDGFSKVKLDMTKLDPYKNVADSIFLIEKKTSNPFKITAADLKEELETIVKSVYKHKAVSEIYADIMSVYDFLRATTLPTDKYCFIIDSINDAIKAKFGDWHLYIPIDPILNTMKIDTFMYNFMKADEKTFPTADGLLKYTISGFMSTSTGASNGTVLGNAAWPFEITKNAADYNGTKWWNQEDKMLSYIDTYLYYEKSNNNTEMTKMKYPPFQIGINFNNNSILDPKIDPNYHPAYKWPAHPNGIKPTYRTPTV